MSNFSSKQRLILGLATGITVAIFFAARSATSWRPQLIGVQSQTYIPTALHIHTPPPPINAKFLTLSPDGQWLRGEYPGSTQRIWNVTTNTSRACDLRGIKFSQDSRTLIGFRVRPLVSGSMVEDGFSVVLQTPEGKEIWSTPPKRLHQEVFSHVEFKDDTVQAITSRHTYSFDVQTGRICRIISRSSKIRWENWWHHEDEANSPDGSKTYSPSEITDWVNILSARNSMKLWSYQTTYSSNFQLVCYPQWEEGGKSLATIERNTLFLRDAQTGKPLITYKSHLPAPLKSWAFTQNRDAVYLMDAKGQIFRQRLR